MYEKKDRIILPNLGGGGAERVALNIADHLGGKGHEVHIILLAHEVMYNLSETYKVHFLSEDGKASSFHPLNIQAMAKRLQQLVARLEQCGEFDMFVSFLPDADRVTAKTGLSNVFYSVHNTLSDPLKRMSRRKAKRRIKRYQKLYNNKRVICVSRGVEQDLKRKLGVIPMKSHVIYNPINISSIRKQAKETVPDIPLDKYLLHVGRFNPQKRHDLLLDAFARLKTPVKLVLLTEPTPELQQMIDERGLREYVHLHGFQKNPFPWMAQAELMVLSSDYEGFGCVIAESLACGTPVVSTDCPSGPNEILTGELAKWLVPMNDPKALGEKVDEALATHIEIPESAITRFSVENIAQQYLEVGAKD